MNKMKKIWKGIGIFLMILGGLLLIILIFTLSTPQFELGELSSSHQDSLIGSSLNKSAVSASTHKGSKSEPVSSETISRLIIKTGTIHMVVKDINSSIKNISQYVKNKNGWVVDSSNSSLTNGEKVPSGNITVRIPSEIFEEAMDYFKKLSEKVSLESTTSEDVTEEYIDNKSRLKNLESAETQFRRIMEKAQKIPDVLSVQKELISIREQIERTKGRIQYLETSAKMSSISVFLAASEYLLPLPPTKKWRPVYIIKQSWNSLVNSLRIISYILIWFVIYAIIWIPLVVIIWQVKKFWKRRQEQKSKM